ncbi:Polyprenol monophosphomannose synthase [Jeotgalibaca dankookensis]|uniref:Polyprenol monophosphomannose synthase n=1 Tax=Jeotgalibaca dankookensis TaxID=708126 RepID=A0A1S6IMB0_9LACT|nr:glycosyltransferase family 2 protein [Jeotgalibaca dankookensis]AQS52677.1 Polyprenol monophosphomannose synthase [Jeotgalibaca dankookensis]
MDKVLVVIPTLKPDEHFIAYVNKLIAHGFESILIVNDGSGPEYEAVFEELARQPQVSILSHAVNLGKGRGLKNALNHFLTMKNNGQYAGIITVDSDGQHQVEDVIKIRDAMLADPSKLYLGSRNFNQNGVPQKSSFGNKAISFIFRVLYGKKIADTQTGLRGIPKPIVEKFVALKGEEFEYEMNMLIAAVLSNIEIEEITIQTVYFDDNSQTNFRPVTDSVAIISLVVAAFFKHLAASLGSFLSN